MKILKKIIHLIGFHNILNSVETGKYELKYDSPFSLYKTRWNEYLCNDCGRTWSLPPGDFFEAYMGYKTTKLQEEISKHLAKKGDFDKAIKVLKI